MPDLGIEDAIRGPCLALPDAEAFLSHGMPNFRRRKGKVFAILALNHHGDGRIALWLNTPPAPRGAAARGARGRRHASRCAGCVTSRSHVRRSLAAWHASP